MCVTADIERFSDAVSKYGCVHTTDDMYAARKLLDTFCDIDIPSTLFILGKFAEEEPHIMDVVRENDHELASHGYTHVDLRTLPFSQLKNELFKSGKLFSSKGFRAPYYGFDKDMVTQLELHFKYDSSLVPVRNTKKMVLTIHMLTESLMEIPISTVGVVPLTSMSLRLFPLPVVKGLACLVLKRDGYLVVNVHPWEFCEVPHVAVPMYVKKNTGPRFAKKISEFLTFLKGIGAEFVTMEQIYEYYRH